MVHNGIEYGMMQAYADALLRDPDLAAFSGYVQNSGEGRWTVEAAIEEAVPAGVLATALYARFSSRRESGFGEDVEGDMTTDRKLGTAQPAQ